MWLERSVMYPTLHSTIREVLDSAEAIKVQFILEPLAFPQLASLAKLHGQRFVEQVSYLTRTFAFYIHREHQNIIKLVNNSNPLCPAITNSMKNICTNYSIFSADADSHQSVCAKQRSQSLSRVFEPTATQLHTNTSFD